MSPQARRLTELRAHEWRELFRRGRATGRSLQAASMARVGRHPALAVGIAALLGLAVFACLRSRSANRRQVKAEQPQLMNVRHEPGQKFTGLLSETLRKAVSAWIIHGLTPPPTQSKS